MSGAEMNFNANDVPPTSPFEPLPNGKYLMAIVASEVKPTTSGKGKYLQLELQVLEGECKGRKVWERLNIVNENATAQDIAQRTLSAICHATGVMKLQNSSQLHNIPMTVKVVIKQDAGFDPRNDVKGYESATGKPAAAAASTAPKPAPASPVAENAPAWARKTA